MKTVTLNIEDNIYDDFISILNTKFPDQISIVDDDIFTEEDEIYYQKALSELKKGEAISLEQLKEELNV